MAWPARPDPINFVPVAIHWKNQLPIDKCMALQKILSRKRKDIGRRKQVRTKGAECLSHSTVLSGAG